MYIETDQITCEFLLDKINQLNDKPKSIRLYIAGRSCSTINFGIGVDNEGINDVTETICGVTFLYEKSIYDQYGALRVSWIGEGFEVMPVDENKASSKHPTKKANNCGGCGTSGGCSGCH